MSHAIFAQIPAENIATMLSSLTGMIFEADADGKIWSRNKLREDNQKILSAAGATISHGSLITISDVNVTHLVDQYTQRFTQIAAELEAFTGFPLSVNTATLNMEGRLDNLSREEVQKYFNLFRGLGDSLGFPSLSLNGKSLNLHQYLSPEVQGGVLEFSAPVYHLREFKKDRLDLLAHLVDEGKIEAIAEKIYGVTGFTYRFDKERLALVTTNASEVTLKSSDEFRTMHGFLLQLRDEGVIKTIQPENMGREYRIDLKDIQPELLHERVSSYGQTLGSATAGKQPQKAVE